MLDITDKNHPINVIKSLGVYDPETGFIPHVDGSKPSAEEAQALSVGKPGKCGSCGGGKVR